MIEDLVRTRLRTISTLKDVRDGVGLASLNKGVTLAYPIAFVYTTGESAQDNYGLVGSIGQRRVQRLGIVLAVRDVQDASRGGIKSTLQGLRDQVDQLLFGWQPDSNHEPLTFARGALLKMEDATLWWQDEYVTAYQRRTT